MSGYLRFTVNLPEEEALAFKERVRNDPDFSYEDRGRYRSNGELAEYVRYLAEEMGGEDE